ncbi:sulfatase [uncultured Ruthenibacterium sp.]|uniref:sulfatase n=1 Tax=uncultured Ruthenibacterium sp. TaxID=1905347 RepID=UPI00349EAAFF
MKAVMLMFDSLNRKMLQPYGCNWTQTPNFQRLSEKAVQFNNCYAGSLPCMPARRELHTGRYNFLHRSWGPVEPFDDSMPQILKEHGIYTHLISDHIHYWEDGGATYHYRYNSWEIIRGQEGDKWKCLPELLEPTTSSNVQNRDGIYFYSTGDLQKHDNVNRQFQRKEENTSLAQTVRAGLDFLDTNHLCDHWFLQIECFDPHEPFFSPQECERSYPDTYRGPTADWPPYHHVTETETLKNHYRAEYATLLSRCDQYLGKVLDKFDQYDLWKDTLLIVNTDHGYLLGEHGWWSKVVMPCYDEIVHLPLFIYDPRFGHGGETRDQIVQTIDIPATLLEFFGVDLPNDMQGKPVRNVICENAAIREYALFGIHGAHVNLFDGRYVYMKAPATAQNAPLYEYTVMPMHMRSLFSVEEMKNAQAVPGNQFSFTKGTPVWKIPKGNGNGARDFSDLLINGKDSEEAKHIDNNSFVNAANFGDKLFDLNTDPQQKNELTDIEQETRLANLLQRAMQENESPKEQFARLGIPNDREITEKDVLEWHRRKEQEKQNLPLAQWTWTQEAINAFHMFMKFLPPMQQEQAIEKLKDRIHLQESRQVSQTSIMQLIPCFFSGDSAEMIAYFVDMASRSQ